jgi:hypothetical protein
MEQTVPKIIKESTAIIDGRIPQPIARGKMRTSREVLKQNQNEGKYREKD